MCDQSIEEIERVGPATFVLQPCGHQVDDRTRDDLTTKSDESSDSRSSE